MESPPSSHGILGYLSSLSPAALDRLYEDAFTTATVFRSLPALAKQYVLRLCLLPEPLSVPRRVLSSWLSNPADSLCRAAHFAALDRLRSLRVLVEEGDAVQVCSSFLRCCRAVLEGRVAELEDQGSGQRAGEEVSSHAEESWDRMLHFVIGSKEHREPAQVVRRLVESIGLVKGSPPVITQEGYRFLFRDVHHQIWKVLLGYLKLGVDEKEMNRDEVLRFMFRLGFLNTNQEYSTRSLTKSQCRLLEDLTSLGLIFQRKPGALTYFVTPLAGFLSSKGTVGTSIVNSKEENVEQSVGFIVVETTFKVYAYTSSTLQILLLSLFCNLQTKLPNLVVGRITKKSVRKAIAMGINSTEIVSYLENNRHPSVIKSGERGVPENVVDQIKLWEDERNRMKIEAVYRLTCSSKEEYQFLRDFLQRHNALVLEQQEKARLFVKESMYSLVIDNVHEWRPSVLSRPGRR